MPQPSKRASTPDATSQESRSQPRSRKKQPRPITLYDAVAGRVSVQGFIPLTPSVPSTRDTASTSMKPAPPEAILMRRHGAPKHDRGASLYAREDSGREDSIYWADRHLTPAQRLPDSDLLKAIHAYAADFYGRTYGEDAAVDYQSMDETALIAMGVLMEEMVVDILGETGHLAFVEEEDRDRERGRAVSTAPVSREESERGESVARSDRGVSTLGEASDGERGRKRRKVDHGE